MYIFQIRHFAGQVWYSVDAFLDKNRDALRPEIVELLASSKESLVSAIAKPLLSHTQTRTLPRGTNGRFVTMKPRTPTVAARYAILILMCAFLSFVPATDSVIVFNNCWNPCPSVILGSFAALNPTTTKPQ